MIADRANGKQHHLRQIAGSVVDRFAYLGSLITNSEGCSDEIRWVIAMARPATTRLVKIWKDCSVSNAWQNLQFSQLSRMPKKLGPWKTNKKKIEAFDIWVYWNILRLSWTENRTNQFIQDELRTEKKLLGAINIEPISLSRSHYQAEELNGEVNRLAVGWNNCYLCWKLNSNKQSSPHGGKSSKLERSGKTGHNLEAPPASV